MVQMQNQIKVEVVTDLLEVGLVILQIHKFTNTEKDAQWN